MKIILEIIKDYLSTIFIVIYQDGFLARSKHVVSGMYGLADTINYI